jgi:hypothetical protein
MQPQQQQQQQLTPALPRKRQQPQQQQQQQRKRQLQGNKVRFVVGAPAAEGRKLLQSLAALLLSVCQAKPVAVDAAAWKVRCRLQLLPHSLCGQQDQQQCSLSDVELSVFQLRAGKGFEVVASAAAGPDGQQLLAALQPVVDDLGLMWTLTNVQIVH